MPAIYLSKADYRRAQLDLWASDQTKQALENDRLSRLNQQLAPPPTDTVPSVSPAAPATAPAPSPSQPSSAPFALPPQHEAILDDWTRNATLNAWHDSKMQDVANGVSQTLSSVPQEAQGWARGALNLPPAQPQPSTPQDQASAPTTAPPAGIPAPAPTAGQVATVTGGGPTASSGYEGAARQAAARYGLDPDIFVRQLNQESGLQPFNPDGSVKVSPAGARGIAQLMPGTAQGLGVNPDDPGQSIEGAAQLMAGHVQRYGGDYSKALAAYNAGPANVDKYGGVPPFPETQRYVANILGGASPQQAQAPTQQAAAVGQPVTLNRPSQFQMGLSDADAAAACGPAAAIAFARAFGRNPTAQEAMQLAQQSGWTQGGGMNGITNEKRLLDALGVPNRLVTTTGDQPTLNWSTITQEVQNGNPVIVSTPGHYFTVDDARTDQSGQTVYHLGSSGTDLRQGADWMSAEQMQRLMGMANGALFADHPQASGSSITETAGNVAKNVSSAFHVKAQDLLSAVQNIGQTTVSGLRQGAQNAANTLGAGLPDIGALNVAQVPGGAASPLGRAVQGQQLTPAEQLMAGGQTVLGYEQAHGQAAANVNPLHNVPLVGATLEAASDPAFWIGATGTAADLAGRVAPAAIASAADSLVAPDDPNRGLKTAVASVIGGMVVQHTAQNAPQLLDAAFNAIDTLHPPQVAYASTRLPAQAAATGLAQAGREAIENAQPVGTPLAMRAQEFLDQARGTPEQQAVVRPGEITAGQTTIYGPSGQPISTVQTGPLEGTAANILLDKFPEEVRPYIQQAAEIFGDFAGQRRGVISDPQALQNAAAKGLGMSVEDFLKTRPGTAFNQETAIALGQTLSKTGQDFDQLALQVQQARSNGSVTPAMEALLANKALEFSALAGVRSGAAAEAGRTLRSFQQALSGEGASNELAVNKAFAAIGSNPQQFSDWLSAWRLTDPADSMARFKLLQGINQGASFIQKVLAFGTANLLSSTKTSEIIALHGTVQVLNRPLLELVRDGDPAAAYTDVAAMGRAIGQAWANARVAFLVGTGPETAAAKMGSTLDIRPEAFPGVQGLIATPMARVISGLHEFSRTLSAAGAMAVAARQDAASTGRSVADLLANPTPRMVAYAQQAAEEAVSGGKMSPVAQAIMNLRNGVNSDEKGRVAAGLVSYALFPFVRIPDYIYRNGAKILAGPLAYVPIAASHYAQAGAAALRGQPEDVSRFVQMANGDMRIAGLTTLVDAAIFAGAVDGNITGEGPSDPSKRAMLMNARDQDGNPVWQPHSIRIGGRWYDYTTAAGPLSIPMAAISSGVEVWRAGEAQNRPLGDIAARAASATGQALLDASYIRTFGDMMKAIGEGQGVGGAGSQFVAGIGERFVPLSGLLAEVERGIDPTMRQGQNPLELMEARLPGLSQNVQPRLNELGQPIQEPQDLLATLSPARSQAPQSSDVSGKVLDFFVNAGVSIGAPPKGITYNGRDLQLTPDEQRQYSQIRGARLEQLAAGYMNSQRFPQLPQQQQYKVLEGLVREASKYADNRLLASIPRDERQQRIQAAPVRSAAGYGMLPQVTSMTRTVANQAEQAAAARHAALMQQLSQSQVPAGTPAGAAGGGA